MTYVPAEDRYEQSPYRRCGRSGIQLPAISLGLWNNFGDDKPLETMRAMLRRAFDRGICHFDLANNYGPPPGSAEINFGRDPARGPRALARRADHLHQGRLRHVGGPLRRVGLAQVPARLARPEPGADGPGLRRHLLLAPARPGHAARGDDGRAGHRRPPGQGALRRHLLLLGRAHARGRADPARARHPAADPPAELLDAQPLGRGGPARRARGRGRRLHRVLAARPGHAHHALPRRRPARTRAPPRASSSARTCSPRSG